MSFVSLLLQVGEKVGCPTDDTTALANCIRATDPKDVTLAFHLELASLSGMFPSLCCVLHAQKVH